MPPALHRLLGNIDLAADELTKLIEDLLAMARLQAGRIELWRSRMDVRDVVSRAVRAVEPLVTERSQTLLVETPPEPVSADVDGERLGRVLRNVLGNAQKYGREGGRIWVRMEDRQDEVSISVADEGPGIPAEDQQRIFERFYRVGGAAASDTGLGLAIARALVELHGGRLWVESTPGAGSTFFMSVPK